MGNLLTDVEFRRVSNRDTGVNDKTLKGTIVDMKGFDEVTFVVGFKTVVNDSKVTFQVAHGATNDTGDMTVTDATLGAIVSDGTTIALSNKQLALAVTKPKHRYLEIQLKIEDENAPTDHITAILSKARDRKTTQGATVHEDKIFQSPDDA